MTLTIFVRQTFHDVIRALRRSSLFALSSVLVGILAPLGCGYVSTSAYLDHIKTIRIPNAVNQTVEFNLEQELTDELRSRFRSKWTDGDDAELRIVVHEYRYKPIRYDVNNAPEQLRMTIVLDYEFRDNMRQKLIDAKRDYEFDRDFYVVAGRGEPPEDLDTARRTLIRDMVDALYYNLAEQW